MAGSLTLWLCLHLCLLLADARSAGSAGSAGSARSARQPGSQGPSAHLDTSANPDSLWSSSALSQNRLLAEVLDLDQRRRSARGADEDEQQSTFGRSFENDFVTAPQPTQLHNITAVAAGGRGNGDPRGNASAPNAPGPSGPLHPLGEGSYGAYGVLLLAGLVLAVGVVGNMAVMCIVWNNYYMRSAWNYLLASMACWDFLVLVLCLPVVVLNQLSQRRMLGDVTCLMVPFMESVSLGVTSFTLCALGVDRFHAATSSSLPNVRRVERCRAVMLKLLLVWLAALLLSSPELFLWQLSQSVSPSTGQLVDSCTITPASSLSLHLPDSLHSLLLRYHQGRMWWCFGCYFCLPVVFTVLCQTATRNVNSESSPAQKQPGLDQRPSGQKRQRHQAVERQLNCTLLALAVVYGVCVLPEHVCNITLAYTRAAVAEDTAAMLALLHHFLLFFKSSVTPVLLLCLCKALGQVFMDCCCCCCQECPPAAAQAPPSSPQTKPKEAAEASIFFDKAKDTSAILSIPS